MADTLIDPTPQTVNVNGGPSAPPPEVANTSMGFGLGVPTPASLPVTGTPIPQPQQPQAAPSADAIKGNIFGKLLGGLSGSHNEYTIDPSTGKTITTSVKEPPGQTFRNILAIGLMGAQGIGHKEGEHTFNQGLLAGLSGGAREATERGDMLDKQRRAQAQQQYADQLKAAEETREQKKLSLQEQLNQVSIANHNQEMAARAMVMEQQAYDFAKKKGMDIAQPMIANSELQVSADKPLVDGYRELGIDAVQGYQNVTANELHQYVANHPGSSVAQIGVHTGTRTTYHSETGKVDVEPLYSIYPPMTKVPPSLLGQLKAMGADKTGNELHATYKNLLGKNDGYVNPRELLSVFQQVRSWENLQKDSLEVQAKQATINAERARAYAETIHGQAEQLGLDNIKEAKAGEDLFSKFYNPSTNSLVNSEYLNPDGNNPKTNKPWTPQEKKQVEKNRNLLTKYVNARFQVEQKDFYDHSRESKDKDTGRPFQISEDPVLNQMSLSLSGLARAQAKLLGQDVPGAATGQATPKVAMASQAILATPGTSLEDALTKVASIPDVKENPSIGVTDDERKQIEKTITENFQQKQNAQQGVTDRIQQLSDRLNQEKINKNPRAFMPPIVP